VPVDVDELAMLCRSYGELMNSHGAVFPGVSTRSD
jgi:hypothetical protein